MSENPKQKKIAWGQYISLAFLMLIGAVCGFLTTIYMDSAPAQEIPLWKTLLLLCGMILVIYIAVFLQTIIHEAGHWVFGKISGYSLLSFRIMSLMWVKQNNKLLLKRFALAGTGGQCLMLPPEMKNGKIPVVLYLMGGPMMNLLAGFAFLGLYALTAKVPGLSVAMLMLAIIGFAFSLINGIPMRLGTVNNDGYNAFAIGKSEAAMRAFWVQLKTNEQLSKGVRLKDMPEEWFVVPTDDEMKNSMIAVLGVFACNRLMDEHRFEDADRLMVRLFDLDSGIIGLHRKLLNCDRLFCELMGENRRDIAKAMMTTEQIKFMKSMRNFPSVLRTQYAYSLLAQENQSKANEVEAQFDKCAKTYPYSSDIQAERELIKIAKSKAHAADISETA